MLSESTTVHTFDVIFTQCHLSGLVKHKFPILITVQGEDNFLTSGQTFRNKDRENGVLTVQKENQEHKTDFCFVLSRVPLKLEHHLRQAWFYQDLDICVLVKS